MAYPHGNSQIFNLGQIMRPPCVLVIIILTFGNMAIAFCGYDGQE